ncbi:hypothetical protein GBAR_LOCUS10326 [Geodia barretti]|uniref:Uncharacterized protein n=1 Tax=Geodia barretti TaxID=519541 RepID=A0AA35RUZ1_GEOBA|nr:hypothetical protein GBAR_LOCUS10326 [Geodia barretti]
MIRAKAAAGTCPLKGRVLKSSGLQSWSSSDIEDSCEVQTLERRACRKCSEGSGLLCSPCRRGVWCAEVHLDRVCGRHLPGLKSGPELI